MANVNTTRGLEPSCGDLYAGKIQQLFVDGESFYLGKTLKMSRDVGNFKVNEDVWIIKLKDPKFHKKFIMISNKTFVGWITIDDIVKY
ncbi:hypothetical protein EOM09_08955 [bacterium]|nr:hypothetical protein [bacterium]